MYNEDDAVAKLDGYLIDVVNGVGFVGEKKLVRIEEAGRTTARAVLVGVDAEAAEAAAADRARERERSEARARRSAAAKKGAARRREREEAERQATETLAAAGAPAEAGTGPAARDEVDPEPPVERPVAAEVIIAPAEAEDAGEPEGGEGEALSSRPRRRGRRGGRRRSRAKAEGQNVEVSE
jgi:ribonuclease G